MKKLLKFLSIFFFVIALLLLGLSFAAGSIVRSFVNNKGESLIGCRMSLQEANVNLFSGNVELDSLVIFADDGVSDFLSIHHLQTKLSVPRLLFGTYALDSLKVDQLRVDIWQRDTLLSCSRFVDYLTAPSDEPTPLVISNIDLRNSAIHYSDQLVGSEFSFNDFSLNVPGVDLRELNTSVGVEFGFVDGGMLKTNIKYNERAQTYELDLDLCSFDLKGILPYVRQQLSIDDLKGTLDLQMVLKGSLAHLLDFSMHGKANIHGLDLIDPFDRSMLRSDSVAFGIRAIDLKSNSIRLSELYLDKPYINIEYGKDGLDNFSRLMPQSATSEAAPADSSAVLLFNDKEQSLKLIVDRFAIRGASLDYFDESLVEEPFVYKLEDFNITAPNFTLTGRNRISANARLGEEGKFTFTYEGYISDLRNLHMQVIAENIDVADFSPYTVQMFGNEISQGNLSCYINADTHQGELTSLTRILLRDPKVEKKRRGVKPEMKVPFRTGMYILTDKDNVCDLELPVKGNVDDPKFSYKRLLFRTLGKLVVKVCTSPFGRHSEDTRSLDDINLDEVNDDLMKDE